MTPIYEFSPLGIQPVVETTFAAVQLQERRDLQRLLRSHIGVISPDTLIIAEEFGQWEDSRRRIDLLGIDRDANLVAIELKRSEDGGHMDLQAIRYAAMVSTMTFDQAVTAYERYLGQIGRDGDEARAEILGFLGWETPDDDRFAQDVRIVLASAEFSLELTTAVLWLNERDLDIRCIRMKPYSLAGQVLVDVQQIIPPPEAEAYQVRVREKTRRERAARVESGGRQHYGLTLGSESFPREPKGRAILRTFQYLVRRGVPPESVAERCGRLGSRILAVVEGEVSERDFLRLIGEARARIGKRFDPIRFFCGETELVRFAGRTYAFSSQWGGADWQDAMANLRDAYPEFEIAFAPVG